MTHSEIVQLVQGSDLRGLSEASINRLAAQVEVAYYRKGDIIFHRGEVVQWAGLITKGLLRVYRIGKNKDEQVWSFLKENNFCIVNYSFFDGVPSEHVVQAIEETKVIFIRRDRYLALEQEDLALKSHVYETLSRKMMYTVQEKSDLLNMNASSRYQYFVEKYPDLIARVPLGQISSFLGIRQSSLSRIRRNLSQSGKSSVGNGG